MEKQRLQAEREWHPQPGPQTEGYHCLADVLGYGGEAGGGKSDLICGLAGKEHYRSLVLRRELTQLRGAGGLEERMRELYGHLGRYNANDKIWRLEGGVMIELSAAKNVDDWMKHMGKPKDFIGFDQLEHFAESQFRAMGGWLRSTRPGQRKRIVASFNPPDTEEAQWIVRYFAPWLDPQHPNPAKPGELRWYTMIDGKEVECADGKPFMHDGELIEPKSRTFIRARLKDNPILERTGYRAQLQAMPEPWRSQLLHGVFGKAIEDHPYQVIPRMWVMKAQERWAAMDKPQWPMDKLGVDVARGGRAETVMTPRHGTWFGKPLVYPGFETPDGPAVVTLIVQHIEDDAIVSIDVLGVGSSPFDIAKGSGFRIIPVNSSAAAKDEKGNYFTDKSKRLRFRNIRAWLWWMLREALDPETGDDLAIYPDPQILSDLCAPRFTSTIGGILIEDKAEISARIGRSPDRGESLVYASDPRTSVEKKGGGLVFAALG